MTITVRFAPSPTGYLHVGNLRLAVINWLFARQQGGRFVLRLDDTDTERSKPEYAAAIEQDLAWVGLGWDRLERQSDRLAVYDEAASRLRAAGRLYPCYETAEELSLKRKSLLNRGLPPIYDRAALKLSAQERAAFEQAGRRPHWRFKLDHDAIVWDDLVAGPLRFEGAAMSDPVLIREDGRTLYALSSVVDDIDFAITHIVRGEDHVSNTAAQVQMFEALGATPPAFAHIALLADAEGDKLSKRLGSLSAASLRESGIEPLALVSFLATLGTSEAIAPHLDIAELIAAFAFSKFSRSIARFDAEELARLNAKFLHALPFEQAEARLHACGLVDADRGFWEAVRGNLERMEDAVTWWNIVHGSPAPAVEEPEFLAQAASLLPQAPWDGATWGAWTNAVKTATGRKGKALFMPLRRALTGRDHGPELALLLPMIGPEKTRQRLSGAAGSPCTAPAPAP
jgi:glutamyl-tRNA synthetase